MERDEALDRMQEIQRIMERTTLCTLLPGLSAVIGGAIALAACAIQFLAIESLDFIQIFRLPTGWLIVSLALWGACAAVAVAQNLVLTARQARRLGLEPLSRPMRLAILSITPTMLVAVVLTVNLLFESNNLAFLGPKGTADSLVWRPDPILRFIVPIWMMCYGLGVYSAGLFSVRAPRILGLAFVAAGAVGLLFFADYGLLLVALSFGLFHIAFGLVVMFKLRKGATE